ncbi:MAG: DNA internalization-related competence protein ComEC/Rec2 [Candidatus Atribacteria bacterium]|nr:DNA internalization-related competence protein ComEC/Rec2 [Candidatus Atribacteria bacterium]
MFNTSFRLHPGDFQSIARFEGQQGLIFGKISQVEVKQNGIYEEIQVKLNSFQTKGHQYSAQGNILLKVYGDQLSLKYGDYISAEVTIAKPALPGNFGEMNYGDYLARHNIFYTDSVESQQVQVIGHYQERNLFSVIQALKSIINQKIHQIYPLPFRGLVQAIVTGDRTEISQKWLKFFQDAGVMHILAISGLHVGILGMAIFFFFQLVPKKWLKDAYKYAMAIIILLGYAAMTGFAPSATRATIMFIMILIGKYLNRPYHLYNSIYFAAMVILLWQPLYLFDAGFLLSFIVTFSIIYLAPIVEEKCSCLPGFLNKSLSVSVSAWLGMAPLSVYFFYQLSFIAIFSNLFIVPLIGIILVLSMISIIISFFFQPLAIFVASMNKVLISFLLYLGEELSSIPFAYQYFKQPKIYMIALYYLIVFFLFYTIDFWSGYSFIQRKKAFWTLSISILFFITVPMIFVSSCLEVHFINVGEGDCILILTPERQNILIDGGGTPFSDFDVGKSTVIPYLRRNGINTIDLLILSHPDLDHLEGLLSVLKEMEVHLVLDGGIPSSHQSYLEFKKMILENEDIQYSPINEGDTIKIEKELDFLVLNPKKTFPLIHDENHLNNNSVVLKLRYKKSSFLFTGDIEGIVENHLLSWEKTLKSDILKVPHHGSNSSTTLSFLEAVQPSTAVISVGKNHFGHPHEEIVQRLKEECQKLLRTDLNGTVLIKSFGDQEYYISTLR